MVADFDNVNVSDVSWQTWSKNIIKFLAWDGGLGGIALDLIFA